MRTPVFLMALALAGAAQAQTQFPGRSLELERHRLDMERSRIEQDLRVLQAQQFRMQTQMSGQAVRSSLYSDVPPIPLVSGGITGLATDTAAAEQARQRAEQARAQAVEQRLQDIRGPRR